MTHWLRNFSSLLFPVSIIKMIHMRLRVDWGVICLYSAIKISISIQGERGVKRENKFMNFIFASKFAYTLIFMPLEHFQTILKFSLILTTFFTLLFRTFRPLKVGMTPLAQKF